MKTFLMTVNSNLRSGNLNKVAILLLLIAGLLTSNIANAQTKSNRTEIGFNLSQYHRDFGVGLHVISPYFFKETIAIKAGINNQWLQHFDGTETTQTAYQNIQLGMRGRSHVVTHNISLYGEGGVFIILPNSNFSSNSLELGGIWIIRV